MWVRHVQERPARACRACADGLPTPGETDIGDLWRCDVCGLLWIFHEGTWADFWAPAPWLTRLRHRKHRLDVTIVIRAEDR